ncbi:Mu transposase C-terminal domain-containing protein [Brucellaceae bacterium D45D]
MSDENPHKYFTAKEVAELTRTADISGVPTTESGMIKWIKRHDPDYIAGFSRKRTGQKGGGGTEYNWSFFHEALHPVLDAEIGRRNALTPWRPPVPPMTIRERHRRYRELAQEPPDLSAPTGMWAESLAMEAGVSSTSIAFKPFLIRKVDRCLVRVDNKKYFSHALEPFHSQKVFVTSIDAAPDLLWVLSFDRPKYNVPAPGKLICIADAKGGTARYVSIELQQAAESKRAAGYAKRRLLR